MHSLRHSYASILLAQGAPLTEVAGLLGHKSPAITLKIYSHWLPQVKMDSVDRLAMCILSPRLDPGHEMDTSGETSGGQGG